MNSNTSVFYLMRCLTKILTLFLCMWLSVSAYAQKTVNQEDFLSSMPNRLYTVADSLPNPLLYLPAHVDTASTYFSRDFFKWQWGKRIRLNNYGYMSTRGSQAYYDAQYGLNRWCNILTTILHTSVVGERMPRLISFIYQVGEGGSVSTQFAKLWYMRRRPVSQMNEEAWGKGEVTAELLESGSFPSSHAAFGWAVALAVAEIIPEVQDSLLARAYSYGESRAIVGAHWMSDVEAGFLTASAAVADMHRLDSYKEGMAQAQNEYYTIKGTQPDYSVGWPNGRRIQAYSAVDTASVYYFSDLQGYWQAKAERYTERGDSAIIDADDSEHALLEMFGNIIGKPLVISTNPYTVQLIRMARNAFIESAQQMSASGPFRKRPYVQLGEPTLIPQEEAYYATRSSYPSTKAMLGWGLALVLSEVIPDFNEELLKRGYDYGQSRIIAGFNYPSDVMAGRLQAAAVLARLHGYEQFRELINYSTAELKNPHYLVTQVNDLNATSVTTDDWYTVTGLQLRAKPSEPGIYIHNGKKVVVRANE